MEQKMVGHFLKWWGQKYQTNHSWHLGSILYLHTGTGTCIHICLYSKTRLKRPLTKGDQLSLNAGQKYYRMLQGEHSAILLTFIELPFVIEIFVLSFLIGCLIHVLLYWQLFCGVHWLAVRWDFSQLKRMGPLGPLLGKLWSIFWNHGTMTRAQHKSEGLQNNVKLYWSSVMYHCKA